METLEIRSKDEVVRDIEETRDELKQTLGGAKEAFGEQNSVRRFWRATKEKASNAGSATRNAAVKTKEAALKTKEAAITAKEKVVCAARTTDATIRSNVYSSIGCAVFAGLAMGYFVSRRLRAARRNSC